MRIYTPLTPMSGHGLSGTVRASSITSPENTGMRDFACASHWSYGVLSGTTRLIVGPTFSRRPPSSLTRSRWRGGGCCCAASAAQPMASAAAPARSHARMYALLITPLLENEFQTELHLPRRRRRADDVRRVGDARAVGGEERRRIGRREVRAVEHVEHLQPDLDVAAADERVLEHRQVHDLQVRAAQRVAADVAVLAFRR